MTNIPQDRINFIISLIIMIVKNCPSKDCYLCYYKISKGLKCSLEHILRKKMTPEAFYNEHIMSRTTDTYSYISKGFKKCKLSHKGQNCTIQCIEKLRKSFIDHAWNWCPYIRTDKRKYLNELFNKIVFDVFAGCETCKLLD